MNGKNKAFKKKSTPPDALGSQYKVILGDLAKLKADIKHVYALAKEFLETKISRRNITKTQ